jgi:hypothetical protein
MFRIPEGAENLELYFHFYKSDNFADHWRQLIQRRNSQVDSEKGEIC